MENKTILLACAAGMSTSLLVSKMEKYAKEIGLEGKIYAVPASDIDGELERNKIDVVLLGPQVRFLEDDLKDKLEPKNIPVGVIPMMDYGMMNGEKVVKFALELIEGK